MMTSKLLPNRRAVSTLTRRLRTTAAYNRRQPSTGWADDDKLELAAVAAAAV